MRESKRLERYKMAAEGKKGSKGVTIFNPYFNCENTATLKLRTATLESQEKRDGVNMLIMAKKHKFREEMTPYDLKHPFMVAPADPAPVQGRHSPDRPQVHRAEF